MTMARPARSPRRPVPAPVRPRLEVVRGRPVPGRRPPNRRVAFGVGGTAFALFALVIAQVLLGQAGFRLSGLEARVEDKRLVAEQLEVDVQRLRAPERIAERASALGMVPAGDVTILTPSVSASAAGSPAASASPSPVRGPASRRGNP
jgi:hypothetical protein